MNGDRVFLYGLVICLAGCSLRPEFSRPETVLDDTRLFMNGSGETGAIYPMTRWWERLDDPLLNNYVDTLLENNPTLMEATERVIQARERYSIQRGPMMPSVSADAGAARSFAPSGSFTGGVIPASGEEQRIYTTRINTELSVSWQADLFGRIRQSINAAEAGLLASRYEREAIQHSLIAELLNSRVSIAVNARMLALARDISRTQENIYTLVKRRYNLGTAGTALIDVLLAEENYRSVRSDINSFERQLAAESYRLDILLGQPPGTTGPRVSTFSLLPPPRDVAACLPVNLLDRRPDLKASELRLAAADAEIGVAMADLYPGLNLGGRIGFNGNRLENLFDADQLAGSLLLNITSRLFEGGALRANVRLKESAARELVARYSANVLDALREVETALKGEIELEEELNQAQQSVDAVRRAESISRSRYLEGIESLRAYLEIQQRLYLSEQNLLRLQQEKWNNRVALYLALGGDWVQSGEDFDVTVNPDCR